ncbi:hypothetical protein [Caenimonas sp. SL110]|uniref:hypothetical protein n=1 Tax=Caenimonas sp. SL110 TaxID=1450524 RepID=UPI0006548B7E|nr:hypothetical protein [Caenimonas sp. SL110]
MNLPILLQHLILASVVALTACSSEVPPDATLTPAVAGGVLKVEAWAGHTCRVRIRGASVENWVKQSGILPRTTLAPVVVQACTGKLPYLSSVSDRHPTGAAVWEASSGPGSAAPIAAYLVVVTSIGADEALLELQALGR